ncbi:sulfite exporter TauE/SafE family protein [Chitiniphilus purpureus]|uniref:Probable membrane transporter protein n=1 Tax=Chitiniphilus purpureus TaxID=2981137 RepID=A0ABY6DQ71_9NEIS|nr:sulfite exporter TauE/SafE family protein [Chitiniphilus sp. CD1]UXY15626.1 sulfite exporter TauE/SafE family protein [Chitiniphilus sp. CD1]
MPDLILLFAVSLVANTLSSLAGGGAGLLQLPILLFLGLPFPVALSTHKLASVALGAGATLKHLRAGTLDWRFSAVVLAWGLPGVWLGAQLILAVPERAAMLALAVLTALLGVQSLLQPQLGQQSAPRARHGWQLWLGGAVLFGIGMLNGSLASGTGLFVTLWLIGWFGMDYKQAVAYTLVLVGLFWNGAGAVALALQAGVHWPWVPALLAASVLGGYLGAHWGLARGNRAIKRAFEVITLATACSLFWKAWA